MLTYYFRHKVMYHIWWDDTRQMLLHFWIVANHLSMTVLVILVPCSLSNSRDRWETLLLKMHISDTKKEWLTLLVCGQRRKRCIFQKIMLHCGWLWHSCHMFPLLLWLYSSSLFIQTELQSWPALVANAFHVSLIASVEVFNTRWSH